MIRECGATFVQRAPRTPVALNSNRQKKKRAEERILRSFPFRSQLYLVGDFSFSIHRDRQLSE